MIFLAVQGKQVFYSKMSSSCPPNFSKVTQLLYLLEILLKLKKY